ncbi:hypothetical protein E2R68_00695 [Psychromonas sp. RZ22]|uniref:hypothetical protein n=1 Tax=Psychromonas algarum TaxID=2555643 RepID=UPI0010675B0C|nr:hypothetical protein [Psychromonas sp. RZ22]TEW56587.1 hypothetical protein E2R68_00695 [Psychromonas sp. RZ22]
MMINISITEPQALNPELDDSIEFVEILRLLGEETRLKYFVITTPEHFVEVMHYARRLLNEHFHYDLINHICRNADGDIQNVYKVLAEYIETKIDTHLSSGLVINDDFALAHEINDDRTPVNAAMMLFSDENWIPNKVVDYAA